jgi:Spy/CpxP family protein refolding chaperone
VNSWKIILAALVIFGAGVMAGSLVAIHHPVISSEENPPQSPVENHEHSQRELPRPPLVDVLGKKFLQQLDDKLKLTAEQKENIQKIIADGQERNREIWTNVAPQMRGVIQDVHKQVRDQLTPEQQKQFEELLKQVRPPRKQNSTNAPPKIAPMTNSPAAALVKPCV